MVAKAPKVRLERRREGIQPMLRAQKIFEALRGHHGLDAKRQDPHLLVHGTLHLAAHLRRLIAARREHEDHDPRGRNGVDDLRCPVG
jgi:hypothetical protein